MARWRRMHQPRTAFERLIGFSAIEGRTELPRADSNALVGGHRFVIGWKPASVWTCSAAAPTCAHVPPGTIASMEASLASRAARICSVCLPPPPTSTVSALSASAPLMWTLRQFYQISFSKIISPSKPSGLESIELVV